MQHNQSDGATSGIRNDVFLQAYMQSLRYSFLRNDNYKAMVLSNFAQRCIKASVHKIHILLNINSPFEDACSALLGCKSSFLWVMTITASKL